MRYAHDAQWLVRLVQRHLPGQPQKILSGIGTETTDTKVGSDNKSKDLAEQESSIPRSIHRTDSRYRDQALPGRVCRVGADTYALVRLQNNQKLSQEPVPKPEGSRGAPRKHGADFQLTAIERAPDASDDVFSW
ncbi:MAG: hypothetical protein U5O69_09050 [Candidatus Competibacteraceae bacterium]|nr:hypothetical protein [Candidatus Competibacteraceae bacterium]